MKKEIAIRRILFATDYSENARSALDYARMIALHFEASVYLIHVVQLSQAAHEVEIEIAGPSLSRNSACKRLDTLADGLRRYGIDVETHVVEGFPGDVIPQSIETYAIDLLVLGIHGLQHGLTYLLMGSTTELLLREAPCPILTIGAKVLSGFDVERDLDHILFVTDLSPEATSAAPYALFLAKQFGVPVHPGVWLSDKLRGDGGERSRAIEGYCRSMQEVEEAERPEWCTPEFQLEHALSTEDVVAKAAAEHDGLIVLGIKDLDSSFARLVLSRATCPVITVRRKELSEQGHSA